MSEQTLARRVAQEQAQAGPAVVMLPCRQVSLTGAAQTMATTQLPAPHAELRLVAVLADFPDGDARLVEALAEGEANVRVSRVITPIAVLDVTAEGLVIVELDDGVSAADLQELVGPTLKISPWVKVLLAGASSARDDGD